jgi:hypothetical protein
MSSKYICPNPLYFLYKINKLETKVSFMAYFKLF